MTIFSDAYLPYPYGPVPSPGTPSPKFVDLLNNQTITGLKTFTEAVTISRGNGPVRYLEFKNANDASSYGRLENSSTPSGVFTFGIFSRQAQNSNGAALLLQADVDATHDASPWVPAVIVQAQRTGGAALTTRPLFGVLAAGQYAYKILADATHDFRDAAGAQTVTLNPGGDISLQKVGGGFRVKEGSNAKQGVATLHAGTVTVANTSVTDNSRIHATGQDNNVTGTVRISGRTPGVSFTLTSTNAADSGVVAYTIFEPS